MVAGELNIEKVKQRDRNKVSGKRVNNILVTVIGLIPTDCHSLLTSFCLL